MNECSECGKKMGLLEGYRHPTMGKKYLLCSSCFNQVEESVVRWQAFVLSNSFNKEASNNNFKNILKFENLNRLSKRILINKFIN